MPGAFRRAARLAVLAGMLAPAAPAGAQPPAGGVAEGRLVVAAGREGLNYHAVAGRIRTLLVQKTGWDVEVVTSRGSIENLARLGDLRSPVSLALAQSDALVGVLAETPELAGDLVPLADVGPECVFLFARRDGPVEALADLGAGDRRLSVDRPGSGATVTWAYLSRLRPELASATELYVDLPEALEQLAGTRSPDGLDAAMLVQRPDVVSPPLVTVRSNPEVYRAIPIRAEDLPGAAFADGRPVYTFETIQLGRTPVETICTRGLVLGSRPKLGDATLRRLRRILDEAGDYVDLGAQ